MLRYGLLIISIGLLSVFISFTNSSRVDLAKLSELPVPLSNERFGFNMNDYHRSEGVIKKNQFLADLLLPHHVSYQTISEVAEAARGVFDVRNLRSGKKYMVLSRDTTAQADFFVYEPNLLRYVIYDLNTKEVSVVEREVERRIQTSSGRITSSLWKTMMDRDLDYELAAKMEDALAWSVDFYHIQNGDQFKAYYEELFVDGQRVGVGELFAAHFYNSGNDYYAIKYASEKYDGFYDLEGRPMKKVFLKSPVKYSRISSHFNPRRFHPILKRVKPHLGTDYAAPHGTPIYAVANGVVNKASYTKGNGNYVKIRHDKNIETQYLHMSRFASGITPGVQVKQGQVIGYVGSTGLATGPHVCFRFWKDGRQVNHLRLNLPEPEPMEDAELPSYYQVRDDMVSILDQIMIEGEEVAVSPTDEVLAP